MCTIEMFAYDRASYGSLLCSRNKACPPEGQFPLSAESVTVADLLKGVGYKTGAIGKWGLGGPGTTGVPNKHGFDYFYGYLCQSLAHRYYPEYLWKNDEKIDFPGNKDGKKSVYSHDLLAEQCLDFIRKNKDNHSFCMRLLLYLIRIWIYLKNIWRNIRESFRKLHMKENTGQSRKSLGLFMLL